MYVRNPGLGVNPQSKPWGGASCEGPPEQTVMYTCGGQCRSVDAAMHGGVGQREVHGGEALLAVVHGWGGASRVRAEQDAGRLGRRPDRVPCLGHRPPSTGAGGLGGRLQTLPAKRVSFAASPGFGPRPLARGRKRTTHVMSFRMRRHRTSSGDPIVGDSIGPITIRLFAKQVDYPRNVFDL